MRDVNDSFLTLRGCTNSASAGSYLTLFGVDYSGNDAGGVIIQVTDGESYKRLKLSKNGNLTWIGNDLAGAAITSYNLSMAAKGYIAFASGLILQWSETHNYNKPGTYQSFIYQLSFTSRPCVLLVNIGFISSERSLLYVSDQQTDKNQVIISGPKQSYFQYFAIGH